MSDCTYKQLCVLAAALDMVGQRWSLLDVRKWLPGAGRLYVLMEGLTGISTNLLAGRTKRLEQHGVVSGRPLPPPKATYESWPPDGPFQARVRYGSPFVHSDLINEQTAHQHAA